MGSSRDGRLRRAREEAGGWLPKAATRDERLRGGFLGSVILKRFLPAGEEKSKFATNETHSTKPAFGRTPGSKRHAMKLTDHLAHVIGLVEKGESPAKIKASLVAMTEEVSGYEQAAANAIRLAEEKPTVDARPDQRLDELQKAVLELKRELEVLKNDRGDARYS